MQSKIIIIKQIFFKHSDNSTIKPQGKRMHINMQENCKLMKLSQYSAREAEDQFSCEDSIKF